MIGVDGSGSNEEWRSAHNEGDGEDSRRRRGGAHSAATRIPLSSWTNSLFIENQGTLLSPLVPALSFLILVYFRLCKRTKKESWRGTGTKTN